MSLRMDMAYKTEKELNVMSRIEMAHYILQITQTDICKDKKYCNLILKLYLKKWKDKQQWNG